MCLLHIRLPAGRGSCDANRPSCLVWRRRENDLTRKTEKIGKIGNSCHACLVASPIETISPYSGLPSLTFPLVFRCLPPIALPLSRFPSTLIPRSLNTHENNTLPLSFPVTPAVLGSLRPQPADRMLRSQSSGVRPLCTLGAPVLSRCLFGLPGFLQYVLPRSGLFRHFLYETPETILRHDVSSHDPNDLQRP